MRRIGCKALLALVVVLGTSSARANETDGTRGRLHFQAGASYFEAGDYADALREFERAYELSGRPQLFYNFALCHEHLQAFDKAAHYLRRYLAETESVPNRTNLERRLEKLEEKARDAADSGVVPSPDESPWVDPVPPVEPAPTSAPPAAPRRRSALRVPAIVSFVVAGVGLTAFGTFGLLALSEQARIEEGCGAGPRPSCSESDVARMDSFALAADIGLGVGIVGATAGLLLWILSRDRKSERAPATAGLRLFGTGSSLGAVWTGDL